MMQFVVSVLLQVASMAGAGTISVHYPDCWFNGLAAIPVLFDESGARPTYSLA